MNSLNPLAWQLRTHGFIVDFKTDNAFNAFSLDKSVYVENMR